MADQLHGDQTGDPGKHDTSHPNSQRTLARPIHFTGVGLMLGVEAALTIHPAEPDSGIRFRRIDLDGEPEIPLPNAELGGSLARATEISYQGASVQTVEHVLSALAGMEVDNARIDLAGPEPPILDGSALPFAEAIRDAGLEVQPVPRRWLRPERPLAVADGDRQVFLLPADRLELTFVFDRYGRPGVSSQVVTVPITPEIYLKEIAPARTFCFLDEVEALRAAGLGRGATDENVLIIGPDGPQHGDYRLPDELARHKLLDLLGDLYLLGRPLCARVTGVRSQHALNLALVRRLLETAASEPARSEPSTPVLSAAEIETILPHRYPFLLVDRVLRIEENRRIVALKNVTVNEEFFRGHFPGHPVMPGVLITEALAQAGGVLLMRTGDFAGKMAYFMTIENAKFRKPVVPGDQLILDVEVLRLRRSTGKLRGEARVDGRLVAEAEFSFAIVPQQRP